MTGRADKHWAEMMADLGKRETEAPARRGTPAYVYLLVVMLAAVVPGLILLSTAGR